MYLTEKEMLEQKQAQLFSLHRLYKKIKGGFDDFCEFLPGVVHLNKIGSVEMQYLDKISRERTGLDLSRIQAEGAKVLEEVIEPNNLRSIKLKFENITFEDPGYVASYFQSIKSLNSKDYIWYYSVKKKFEGDLTLSITNPLSTLGDSYKKIDKVLEEDLFIRKNFNKYASLTKRERQIIRLIAKGLSSQQMAEQLVVSIHTINTHRKNIWQKLEVSSYPELIHFAEQFELEE